MDNIESLRLKANTAAIKLREAIEEERDKIQRPILRKLVGKCFVFQNSYGCGSPPWPFYCRIISFNEKDLSYMTTNFQHTSRNHIEIDHRKEHNFNSATKYGVDPSWQPISVAEYNREKKKLMRLIEKLLN